MSPILRQYATIGLLLCIIGGVLISFSGVNILIRSRLAPPSPMISQEQLHRTGTIYMIISFMMGVGIIGGGVLGYYTSYRYGGVWIVGIGLMSMFISTSALNIVGGLMALIGGVTNIIIVTRYYKRKRGK